MYYMYITFKKLKYLSDGIFKHCLSIINWRTMSYETKKPSIGTKSIIKINKVKFDLSIGTISLCEYTCIFSLYFLSICSPTRFYVEHSRQQLYMLKCVHTTQISKIILYNKIAYSKNWENSQNILFYRNSG